MGRQTVIVCDECSKEILGGKLGAIARIIVYDHADGGAPKDTNAEFCSVECLARFLHDKAVALGYTEPPPEEVPEVPSEPTLESEPTQPPSEPGTDTPETEPEQFPRWIEMGSTDDPRPAPVW